MALRSLASAARPFLSRGLRCSPAASSSSSKADAGLAPLLGEDLAVPARPAPKPVYVNSNPEAVAALVKEYERTKAFLAAEQTPIFDRMNPAAIYATNELRLRDVDVFGFDYDYTLAEYSEQLGFKIYEIAQEILVSQKKYPKDIYSLPYDPNFAIRGLHYDVKTGFIMKLDGFHRIALDTVHYGHERVSQDQVLSVYQGLHVPMDFFYGANARLRQLTDIFSMPEVTLLANLIQYFKDNDIVFAPNHLYWDVKKAISAVHKSGLIHRAVMNDVDKYLRPNPNITKWLNNLLQGKKKLFLTTNSAFGFVDCGMNKIIGKDWRDLFEVVIVTASKPAYFTSNNPFRLFDLHRNVPDWGMVSSLEKGKVYQGGNVDDFTRMTGWAGGNVLYFGDHVYTDLQDPSQKHGWRTGAVIRELTYEVEKINSPDFQRELAWNMRLQNLCERLQFLVPDRSDPTLRQWFVEFGASSGKLRNFLNPRFGSVFRTKQAPTYFSRRLYRFADVYTSSIDNFLPTSPWHTIYPRRHLMPHEAVPHVDIPLS